VKYNHVMPSSKKRKPNLVCDFPISSGAFIYIHNRRYSTKEPSHETLDRILEQHERLVNSSNLAQKERDEEDEGSNFTFSI
jgi:hypothetical protein